MTNGYRLTQLSSLLLKAGSVKVALLAQIAERFGRFVGGNGLTGAEDPDALLLSQGRGATLGAQLDLVALDRYGFVLGFLFVLSHRAPRPDRRSAWPIPSRDEPRGNLVKLREGPEVEAKIDPYPKAGGRNLVACCRPCNVIKGSRMFESFEEAKAYVRGERERLRKIWEEKKSRGLISVPRESNCISRAGKFERQGGPFSTYPFRVAIWSA